MLATVLFAGKDQQQLAFGKVCMHFADRLCLLCASRNGLLVSQQSMQSRAYDFLIRCLADLQAAATQISQQHSTPHDLWR